MAPSIVKNVPMPMHRHPEARLVLITSGEIAESELAGVRTYSTGDFFLRPPFFVHSNLENDAAKYVRLPISYQKWRATFANGGWQTHRGHLDLSPSDLQGLIRSRAGGDQLLDTNKNLMGKQVPWMISKGLRGVLETMRIALIFILGRLLRG